MRIGDGSTEFFPHDIAVPKSDPKDNATRAAFQLAHALKQTESNLPYQVPGDKTMEAIKQLAEIFGELVRSEEKVQPTLTRVKSVPKIKNKKTKQYNPIFQKSRYNYHSWQRRCL